MSDYTLDELCKKAAEVWGPMLQILKLVEEMGELTQVLMKYYNKVEVLGEEFTDKMKREIADELVDVDIMLSQIFMYFLDYIDEYYDESYRKIKAKLQNWLPKNE